MGTGWTLGTTTKLNWARWLPVCGCPHVLLPTCSCHSVNHRSTLPLGTSVRMVSGLPLHAYDSENRATLRPSLNFATPFPQNSFLASFASPRPKNWWRAVDECRSIFQIDSVNHGNTLPLETSDKIVSGLPLHAYDSENRATLSPSPKLRTPLLPNYFPASFAFARPKNWWRAVDECRSIFQIDGVNHGNAFPLETSDRMVSGLPCLLYTSPSPRDQRGSRMPSSA